MKKIVFPLLLLLCIFSCQKEDPLTEEEAIETTIIKSSRSPSDDTYSPREELEISLRWVSYITGSVLRDSPEAKLEIAALLQSGNTIVKLHEILENNTVFATTFHQKAGLYLIMGYPNHDKTRPNPPPIGSGQSNHAAIFINYILNEQCIELYFPKSMDYAGNYTITTTGHPMNAEDDSNAGIIRYYEPQLERSSNLYSTTHNVMVTPAYVQNYNNIIIARPYRLPSQPINGISCDYIQYDDIEDFTDFLDY
ncbi:hypothetical protein H2O64_20630 [Kordia sp. YSTF-M3]|uniref:Lipoprotein n=1 Tax=Kordia aestuariivivens TaxID=2759037 RepID=A0ABR7QEV4_9FLAO|nr:hypothetical protein [Kordia aestuariivivens]MBC8757091.1 hypothetical protein [Kordia aestuariivivens]